MIEVNFLSVPVEEPNSMVGHCVARSRFDKEKMGVGVNEFVKGFLANNLEKFEIKVGNPDVTNLISGEGILTRRDLACINYCLQKSGFKFEIFNVADDEDNSVGVPSGIVEWNVIDRNFVQDDYPTSTKFLPSESDTIVDTLKNIVNTIGVFGNKFVGIKNPFTELFRTLDTVKKTTGMISPGLTAKVYETLDQLGFRVLCLSSEED